MTLRQWQQTRKNLDEYIIQASQHDMVNTFCSIGMSYKFQSINTKQFDKYQIGIHDKLVLCAFSCDTDKRRREYNLVNRKNISNTLKGNNMDNISVNENNYFELLPQYKFVISPEGNGIDCHRHYEALLAGCIPIVEESVIIRNKYGNCPILYTKDYSEITNEYLIKKYNEMIDTKYDFSLLLLSSFNEQDQQTIKTRGNYWIQRLCNNNWYYTNNHIVDTINNFDNLNCYEIYKKDNYTDNNSNNNNKENKETNIITFSLKDSKTVPIDIKLLSFLKTKHNGFFIDIGIGNNNYNNTLLLETKYNWKGVITDSSKIVLHKLKSYRNDNNIYIDYDIISNNPIQSLVSMYNISKINLLCISDNVINAIDVINSINFNLNVIPEVILVKINNYYYEYICNCLNRYYNLIGNFTDYYNNNDYYLFVCY